MSEVINTTQLTISLLQDGNTLEKTSDEYEGIEVKILTQGLDISDEDGTFFTIKTNTSWSFNDREEWISFFDNHIAKYLPKEGVKK